MRCKKCSDFGWIYALSRANPLAEFAFLCNECDAPTRRRLNNKKSGSYWRPEFIKDYSLIEFTADSLLAANELQKGVVNPISS